MIVLITGDFCVGKDTVADLLKKHSLMKHDCAKFKKILSYTTRLPRENETNTHIFCTKDTFLSFNDFVAKTKIDDSFYGARASQFNTDIVNLYCVDGKGAVDIIESEIDNVFVIEVVRPKWLIDCPKSRINRERAYSQRDNYFVDYIIMNDGDLAKLETSVRECYEYLIKKVKKHL